MKNSRGFAPIVIILIVLVLVGGVYYIGTLKNKPNLVSNVATSTPFPTSTSVPTVDPAANWKTYASEKYGFSLRYPDGWTPKLVEVGGPSYFTLTYGKYEILMLLTREELVGKYVFDDYKGNFDDSVDIKYPGAYINIIGSNINARRLVSSDKETAELANIWQLAIKNKNGDYTDDPKISYTLPLRYDPNTLTTMDQILSNFKFTK